MKPSRLGVSFLADDVLYLRLNSSPVGKLYNINHSVFPFILLLCHASFQGQQSTLLECSIAKILYLVFSFLPSTVALIHILIDLYWNSNALWASSKKKKPPGQRRAGVPKS